MNLNRNPRMEYLLVRESKELAEFNIAWIDDLFKKKKAGKQFKQTHESHEKEFLADGIVVLYNIQKDDVRENAIEVLKMRYGKHEKKMVLMKITENGLKVFPQKKVFV